LIFHFAWQEQISVEAADAKEPGVARHDALGLDAMGLDIEEPDAMEYDTGPKVLCHVICLSGHFFLELCSLSFEKGALGSDMPT
jgi:hypothetical protein